MGRPAGKASKKQKAHKARKAEKERQRQMRRVAAATAAETRRNKKNSKSSSSSSLLSRRQQNVPESNKPIIPRGLQNLGNTCFLNAIIQTLARNQRLRSYFVDMDIEDDNEQGMTGVIRKFLSDMINLDDRNVYSPKELLNELGKRSFAFKGRDQQDAHEALRIIVDALVEEEVERNKKAGVDSETQKKVRRSLELQRSFIESSFTGTMASTITCQECGHSSTVTEPFCDLSVPLVSTTVERAQPSTVSECSEVIPLPAPSSSASKGTSNVKTKSAKVQEAPRSVQEELLQKVVTYSPIDSEDDMNDDVPLLEGGNEMEVEEDADVGLAEWANIFNMDSTDENTEDTSIIGPEVKPPVKQVEEKKAPPAKASRMFPVSLFPFRGRGDKYRSLSDSIAEFTKTEVLDGENAYGCEKCTERKRRQILFEKAKALEDDESMSEVTSEDNTDDTMQTQNAPVNSMVSKNRTRFSRRISTSPVTSSESENDDNFTSPKLKDSVLCKIKDEPIATVRTRAEKKLQIRSAPPTLIVQLKRFQHTSLRGNMRKISGHVTFPKDLSLDEFMEVSKKPRYSFRTQKKRLNKDNDYQLTGVVVHMGSIFGGHYTSYVRSRSSDEWYFCNDSKVSKAQEKDVFGSEAYILVYEKM
eukprot:Plantae.Rhodophyta-Hildenbrandia_rubra.ctg7857.p1 GENE.Plantae.Rhodophyta-Hildenbrandia_rubra.ctg7857~~Plantae.Rhodophyta-Hildenbrandia_rubra.ctg7857.p1  ORF type:complete len:643 (-),score=122.22 Plantae.Rhodophyta-Hildenbrandia_rubra.ctg7857:2717-4645(-)